MEITPEKVDELYKKYESAQKMWTNINSENINANSNIMYNLYRTLEEGEILNSTSSYEKKKIETENRLVDLGNFMFDTESTKILANKNNEAYAFLLVEDNPFIMSDIECEKVYQINSNETVLETKARTIDCENKIAKICMAQIANILEPDAKSRATSENDVKKELVIRGREYAILLNKLQGLKLYEHPELQNSENQFTKEGFFNMTRFLEKSNQTNIQAKPLELKEEYEEIVNTAKKEENIEFKTQSIQDIEYDINDLGRFAIAKRLMGKMYEYKEMDIYDMLTEYDLIKGTDAESKVLITSNKDARAVNKHIDRVLHVAIKGYNQPFSVHVRDDSYKRYEEKFGEIPSTVLAPVTRKSKVTFKLDRDINSIIHSVYKQNNEDKTIKYLMYLEELQDIDGCRKKIKEQQKIEKELEKEIKKENESARQTIIDDYNKKIKKYTREISRTQKQKEKKNAPINRAPKAKPGEFDGRKKIQKKSQKANKGFVMQRISEAIELQEKLDELIYAKKLLEDQLDKIQGKDERAKDE